MDAKPMLGATGLALASVASEGQAFPKYLTDFRGNRLLFRGMPSGINRVEGESGLATPYLGE